MIKCLTKRVLFSVALLLSGAFTQATGYMAGDCYPTAGCGYAPFTCGDLTFEFKAGVAPKLWTQRGHAFAVRTNHVPRFVDLGRVGKFHCFFKTPWTIGIKVGWLLSCNIETFLEFDYIQAQRKCHSFRVPTDTATGHTFGFSERKLKEYYGFLGGRYYFDRWFCNTTSWFVGAKVGVTGLHTNNNNCSNECSGSSDCSRSNDCSRSCSNDCGRSTKNGNSANFDRGFFRNSTSVTGGVHTGFNVNLWCGFSFVFTAEVIAQCGPGGEHNIAFPRRHAKHVSNLSIGHIGTEVTFPVTFGIQYTF